MRVILSLLLTLVGLLCILLGGALFHFSLTSGFSWTISALLPWIILIVCAILIILVTVKSKTRKLLMLTLGIVLSAGLIVGIAIERPIYSGDYNKEGKAVSIEKNSLLDVILASQPNYDGLICIASPSCPFCKDAVSNRLRVMKERNPKLAIGVALFTSDSSNITRFQKETDSKNLDYFLSPDIKGTIDLCKGAFPTFIYIKNKKITHIWGNSQMGYPALDWIEAGLE